ncbi:DMT family transporter [Paenibacillus periandrae]|uniref:DMT family transporter n=1 Tax=Paenibacillus periandrae TaxID=1761741 RepID=UPI001F0978A4|nr:DMT family transporter [Paenibacillus periandrae]
MDEPVKRGQTYLLLVIFTIIFGLNLIAVKLMNAHSQPITITGCRLVVAGIMIFVYVIWKRQFQTISLRHGMYLLWICLTGMVLHHSLLSIGLTLTSAVHAALIMALTPLTTSVMAYFILNERLTSMKIIGIVLGIAGISLIIWNDMAVLSINAGDLLVCAAMFCQSLSFILIKKLQGSLSDAYMTSLLLSAGGILLLLLGWFVEKTPITEVFLGMDTKIIAVFLFSSFLATALGSVVWNQSVRKLGPGKASIFLNTVPFYGIFAAALILQEKVYPYHVLGLLVVITGVYLGTVASRKQSINAG